MNRDQRRAIARVLRGVNDDRISLYPDWRYRNDRGYVVDDAVYAAEGLGLLVLLPFGLKVTDIGQAWLDEWRAKQSKPAAPVFAEAGNA